MVCGFSDAKIRTRVQGNNTTGAACGEQVMAPKAVEQDGQTVCRACAVPFGEPDGRGLNGRDGP